MDSGRLCQIEELYHAASELMSDRREAFLRDACGNDDELFRNVWALLAQDPDGGLLETPAVQNAASLLNDSPSKRWTAGTQIGPYEIMSRLGEGGMGEVFRARDTRLGREVAIKVAHEEFSGRFLREARSISALNHPNICTLYDVGPNYLVMELVEGANLAGPVPVETAIGYARQIVAGLEAAHEKGIVHRDLKPANIRVTPTGALKILDFGLAKKTESLECDASTVTVTEKGLILGTAAYMSPEQARGEVADKRADIWAFGVILYELLTGKMLFGGSRNVSDVLAAVLTREPDFSTLPKGTPPRVRRLLDLCLRKDPKLRLQSIGDARIRLDEAEFEAHAPKANARRWPWAVGAAALAILTVLAWYRWPGERHAGPFQHIQLTKLTDSGKASAAAISPDGKYVVHVVTDEGKSSLWMLHAATGSNVQILAPAQGNVTNLRFSRDGNSLFYVFNRGKSQPIMYTMPVLGGNARALSAIAGSTFYVSANPSLWTASLSPEENRVAFTREAGENNGLFVANLDGSGERQLAARKPADFFHAPAWSPDGKTLAYALFSFDGGVHSGLATMPAEGGPEQRIGSRTWYQLLALRWLPDGSGLVAVANAQFPVSQLWYVSYPEGQTRRITNDLNSYGNVSLNGDATALVTVQYETNFHIWVTAPSDPESAREISTGRLDGYNGMAWASNGNIYFEAPDNSTQDTQIWITAADGTGRRQITSEHLNGKPAPCGADGHMAFLSFRAGTPHIWRSDPDGGKLRQLTNGAGEWAPSCSPDGAWITYRAVDEKRGGIWRMPIEGGTPTRLSDRPGWSQISPDGTWVMTGGMNADDKITIIPANGGAPNQSFDPVSELNSSETLVHWSVDGSAILYVKTIGGVSNVWQRPLKGGEPKQLTAFTSLRISSFAVSRGGSRLALARGSSSSDVVLIRDLK